MLDFKKIIWLSRSCLSPKTTSLSFNNLLVVLSLSMIPWFEHTEANIVRDGNSSGDRNSKRNILWYLVSFMNKKTPRSSKSYVRKGLVEKRGGGVWANKHLISFLTVQETRWAVARDQRKKKILTRKGGPCEKNLIHCFRIGPVNMCLLVFFGWLLLLYRQ